MKSLFLKKYQSFISSIHSFDQSIFDEFYQLFMSQRRINRQLSNCPFDDIRSVVSPVSCRSNYEINICIISSAAVHILKTLTVPTALYWHRQKVRVHRYQADLCLINLTNDAYDKSFPSLAHWKCIVRRNVPYGAILREQKVIID